GNDSGGQSGPGGGGAFSIIAGGDEALGWAVYQVPLANTDRPTQLDLHVQSIIAGGDEELGWWVGVYSFSQARWEWLYDGLAAPGARTTDGNVTLTLNSAQVRRRFVNLGDAVSVQAYIALVAEPKGQGGGAGLTISPGT